MSLLGSDFIPSDPQNTESVSNAAARIRDVKQRLKDFVSVMFNPDTGNLNNGVVVGNMLENVGTAGNYGSVTVDVHGRVINGNPEATYSQGDNILLTTVGNNTTVSNIVQPFHASGTLVSSTAATPVILLPTVPSNKKLYIEGITVYVNGATTWATVANVTIQDTTGTDLLRIPVASLTPGAYLNITDTVPQPPVVNDAGGALGAGVQIRADVNGTGSDIKVVIHGVIK